MATFLDSYLYFCRKHQNENGTEGGVRGERGRSRKEEWEETQDGRGEKVGEGKGKEGNRREEKRKRRWERR